MQQRMRRMGLVGVIWVFGITTGAWAQSEEVDGPPMDTSLGANESGYDPKKAEQEKYDPLREEYSKINNPGGIYAGFITGFGQANSTEDGSTAGLFSKYGFEAGYIMKRGEWSRFQMGGEFAFGSAKFRLGGENKIKSTLTLGLSILAKAGFGHSLGGGLFGMFTVGAGPFMASYEGKDTVELESTETLSGIAVDLGYHLAVPMGDTFEFTGGVAFTHLETDVGEVKVKAPNGGKVDFDKPIILNIPQVNLGLRVRL